MSPYAPSPYQFTLGALVERQGDAIRGRIVEVRTHYAIVHFQQTGETVEIEQFDRSYRVLERAAMCGDRYNPGREFPPAPPEYVADAIDEIEDYDEDEDEEAALERAEERFWDERCYIELDHLGDHEHMQIDRAIDDLLFRAR